MRHLSFCILAIAAVAASGASAQDRGWTSTVEGQARWNACYKETRLIFRTRNLSLSDYRAEIKDARKAHMQVCMARATPPASVRLATPVDKNKHPESSLVSWAASP